MNDNNIDSEVQEKFGTRAVKNYPIRGPVNALTTPIYASSTYKLDSTEQGAHLSLTAAEDGWLYSRWGNPTTDVAQRIIASLENAYGTLVLSSGMSAITTAMLALLNAGDHIIMPKFLYGGTYEFLDTFGKKLGYEVTFVDSSNIKNYADAIRDNTRLVYAETPSNPAIRITDLTALAKLAKEHNLISMVDSTFASPYNQRPIDFGIDIVLHSATKYLGGHSDIIAGCIATSTKELLKKCHKALKLFGGVQSPFESYLLIRGLKTLEVRMVKHNENAIRIAQFLENHPKIAKVNYPGLPSHPDYELAKKQLSNGFGGMLSFEIKGGVEAGRAFVENLKIINLAVSLGGVESLIEHAASITHSMVPKEERESAGITDGLIRLSVGIEDINDLIKDLDQALALVP